MQGLPNPHAGPHIPIPIPLAHIVHYGQHPVVIILDCETTLEPAIKDEGGRGGVIDLTPIGGVIGLIPVVSNPLLEGGGVRIVTGGCCWTMVVVVAAGTIGGNS